MSQHFISSDKSLYKIGNKISADFPSRLAICFPLINFLNCSRARVFRRWRRVALLGVRRLELFVRRPSCDWIYSVLRRLNARIFNYLGVQMLALNVVRWWGGIVGWRIFQIFIARRSGILPCQGLFALHRHVNVFWFRQQRSESERARSDFGVGLGRRFLGFRRLRHEVARSELVHWVLSTEGWWHSWRWIWTRPTRLPR